MGVVSHRYGGLGGGRDGVDGWYVCGIKPWGLVVVLLLQFYRGCRCLHVKLLCVVMEMIWLDGGFGMTDHVQFVPSITYLMCCASWLSSL